MSDRAERGFKYMVLDFTVDSTNKRFPSASESSNNETTAAAGVCKAGQRIIIESVTNLSALTATIRIGNGTASVGGANDYFDVFVNGAGPAKVFGVEQVDGLGAAFVTSGTAQQVMIAYSVVG